MSKLTLTVTPEPRVLALVLLMALGVLAIALHLTALTLQALTPAADESPADMTALVDGYSACLSAPYRTTECRLEYDGDGTSNTPADWHWYWREQSCAVLTPEEVTLLWEN